MKPDSLGQLGQDPHDCVQHREESQANFVLGILERGFHLFHLGRSTRCRIGHRRRVRREFLERDSHHARLLLRLGQLIRLNAKHLGGFRRRLRQAHLDLQVVEDGRANPPHAFDQRIEEEAHILAGGRTDLAKIAHRFRQLLGKVGRDQLSGLVETHHQVAVGDHAGRALFQSSQHVVCPGPRAFRQSLERLANALQRSRIRRQFPDRSTDAGDGPYCGPASAQGNRANGLDPLGKRARYLGENRVNFAPGFLQVLVELI